MILTRRRFLGTVASILGLSLVPFGLDKMGTIDTVLSIQLDGTKEASTTVPWDFLLTSVECPKGLLVEVKGKTGGKVTFSGGNTSCRILRGDILKVELRERSLETTYVNLKGKRL